MSSKQYLQIRQRTFHAMHYLKGHPKCGALHGHTFIVSDLELEVEEGAFVDFGKIKQCIDQFDHKTLIDRDDADVWSRINVLLETELEGVRVDAYFIDGMATCENIAKKLAELILGLPGVITVSFSIYEGLEQGVEHCGEK